MSRQPPVTSLRYVAALQRVTYWFALVLAFSIPFAAPTQLRALDLAAFYCAGEALTQHADPYLAMPLSACESRVARNGPIAAGVAIPAPLPPYTLGAFALLSHLPFEPAQHIFDLLSLAALALSILLLRRTAGRPTIFVASALAPIAWTVFAMGQTAIFTLAALSATAFFLERDRDGWGALCACTMMAEPHLGLPVCLALFLYRPRTRLAFIAGAALAVTISLTVIPWSLTAEYLAHVLPLHALSEARAAAQISFTSLLTFFGVADHLAVILGGTQYAATAAFFIWIARKFGSPSAIVCVSALAALLGGSFLHGYDLLLAIPAALTFWDRRPLIAALAIIAISPHFDAIGGVIAPVIAMASAVILLSYAGLSFWRASAAVPLLVLLLLMTPLSVPHTGLMAPVPATAYAERSWSAWEAANPRSPWWFIKNLPDWIGIITLCFLAASHIGKGGAPFRLRAAMAVRSGAIF